MSAAEIDRVTTLAALMRRAYPGRSLAYCAERSALVLADVAIAGREVASARYALSMAPLAPGREPALRELLGLLDTRVAEAEGAHA